MCRIERGAWPLKRLSRRRRSPAAVESGEGGRRETQGSSVVVRCAQGARGRSIEATENLEVGTPTRGHQTNATMPLGELSKYIDEEIQKREGGSATVPADDSDEDGDEELPLYRKRKTPVASLQVEGASETTAQRLCYSCGKATGYCYEQVVARKSICLPLTAVVLILLFLGWAAASGYNLPGMGGNPAAIPSGRNSTAGKDNVDPPPSEILSPPPPAPETEDDIDEDA